MTDTGKQKLYQISEELLQVLLNYKESNPEFTFSLRTKDGPSGKEQRLENGGWFQGSHYIFVPFFKPGDNIRRVKTLGFVLDLEEDGNVADNYIEISFKGGIDSEEDKQFHCDLAAQIGLQLNPDNWGKKYYKDGNYLDNLVDFLNQTYPVCVDLLKKHNLLQLSEVCCTDDSANVCKLRRIYSEVCDFFLHLNSWRSL